MTKNQLSSLAQIGIEKDVTQFANSSSYYLNSVSHRLSDSESFCGLLISAILDRLEHSIL